MSTPVPKSAFTGLDEIAHLAAGGEAPPLREHVAAAQEFLADKAAGMPGRQRMYAIAEGVKARLARLVDGRPADIAFLGNASEGLFVAASAIDWKRGDNVVAALAEFPSVLHAWGPFEAAEVRAIGRSSVPDLDEFRAAVDQRTRIIAASHVSYLTGARLDLSALREIADSVGARLVIDASHSLGVVPVDGRLCDVVVSCAYKWLLGVHGVGVFHVNAERWPDPEPPWVGWHSIEREDDWTSQTRYRLKPTSERFEPGNYGFLSLYLLDRGLAAIEAAGVERIERHVLRLGGELRAGLEDMGLPVLTPLAPATRAGNIAFASDRPEALAEQLRAQGVIGWGGNRRLRLSVHGYNDDTDVTYALEALRAAAL